MQTHKWDLISNPIKSRDRSLVTKIIVELGILVTDSTCNKHTESIAKAIQVPHRPQQIQICNHYFGALFYRQGKSGKFWIKGNNSWKSMSTVTKVELDQYLFIWKLSIKCHWDMWKHSREKSGKQRSRYGKGHFRPCPGFCYFCYILLKYVMFEQNLVFQVDMSSFLHFGAKSTKNNEKSPISGKI